MIKANIIFKEIFEEFHRMMPGNEELNKKFRFGATGDGKAIFVGDFILNLHLENGNITILNPPKNVEIDIKGNYTFEEKKDVHDKMLVYNIVSAGVHKNPRFPSDSNAQRFKYYYLCIWEWAFITLWKRHIQD